MTIASTLPQQIQASVTMAKVLPYLGRIQALPFTKQEIEYLKTHFESIPATLRWMQTNEDFLRQANELKVKQIYQNEKGKP